VEGVAALRTGIRRGVVAIEHGYGHWAQGARGELIGNERWHASEVRALGAAYNRLGFADPTRPGFSTLADVVVGSNARQALPVRLARLA
jgi:tetrathionate reductase subunit A